MGRIEVNEESMALPLPAGFRAAGVYCGIKRNTDRKDIALVVCDDEAVGVGVYTRNRICAAPVVLDRERTPSANVRAVIVNAGNANACTGPQGDRDARTMCQWTAQATGCQEDQVLVMSTGIIGEPLPMEKIQSGIAMAADSLEHSPDALRDAAHAILTTDTVEKIVSRTVRLGSGDVTITGFCKGSGMIAPNMATMLAVILTDAHIAVDAAQEMLQSVSDRSFNCISVDGHMSTNDTVLLLASGKASPAPVAGDDVVALAEAVEAVATDMARKIVDDGEGATHLVEIHVRGSDTRDNAMAIARSVAMSPLVKTAIAGADPNWGRIVSAAGYAGPDFRPEAVGLKLNGTQLYRDGTPLSFDTQSVSVAMKENRQTLIELTFGEGDAEARFWTCDLTKEYVAINADYHT